MKFAFNTIKFAWNSLSWEDLDWRIEELKWPGVWKGEVAINYFWKISFAQFLNSNFLQLQ